MRRNGTNGLIEANGVEKDNIISILPLHLLKSILMIPMVLIHFSVIPVLMALTVIMDTMIIMGIMTITAEKDLVVSST